MIPAWTLTLVVPAVLLAGYFFGRRSTVARALDRRLARETARPLLNDQSAQDRGEATG